jgi:quercetin dioxygenase-like cupin family protein
VLEGELSAELNGEITIVKAGESVVITPGMVHLLKTNLSTPVRVLCTNFPGFDSADIYVV